MILGLPSGQVSLARAHGLWADAFAKERARILAAIGQHIVGVEHVGSTAIPPVPAKPILDIMVGVQDFEEARVCVEAMVALGYTYRGQNGVPRRHYFVKGRTRTHHVHMVEVQSNDWRSTLRFRDLLRARPELAREYANEKERLVRQHSRDREEYQREKGKVVEKLLSEAVDGAAERREPAPLREIAAIANALPQLREYEPQRLTVGKSASSVYRLASPGKPTLFLKVSAVGDASDLKAERDCLHWLASRALVPRILDFSSEGNLAYLLTESIPGASAEVAPARLWPRITTEVAFQLRQLHSLDVLECRFDRSLDQVLPLAATRARSGQVDESAFDLVRHGCSAMELLDSLYRERPQDEDIVVTHGDACLPNLIFHDSSFGGFVDCGRCGRADRYQDLALAHRSIERNFGSRHAENLLSAYGVQRVDRRKLSYYRLLDEFF